MNTYKVEFKRADGSLALVYVKVNNPVTSPGDTVEDIIHKTYNSNLPGLNIVEIHSKLLV